MSHNACAWPGILALENLVVGKNETDIRTAKKLTETCIKNYMNTKTQLGPQYMHFDPKLGMHYKTESAYRLESDLVETLFYMWRLTKIHTFKTAAWHCFKMMQKYCKGKYGYSTLLSVHEEKAEQNDEMPSYFLSKTLKYLFMTFGPDDIMPVDHYFMTPGGHILTDRKV